VRRASKTAQKSRKSWSINDVRAHIFEWMARLAAAQADFYEAQAYYMTQAKWTKS